MGGDRSFELLRFAYADKMCRLAEQYLGDKWLSKHIVNDTLQKIWQERNLEKDGHDFRSLIMTIVGTAISSGAQQSTSQSSDQETSVRIDTVEAKQHENLIEDYQQCIKNTVEQAPPGLKHFFQPVDNDVYNIPNLSQNKPEGSPSKKDYARAAMAIRNYLQKKPDFAMILLLMAVLG